MVRGGRVVLPDLSCVLPSAQVTGLLGPSGGGKSTLIRAIVGVQQVQGGRVEVLGQPAGSAALRRQVGYVTQAPSVYADLTVAENLRFFARVLGAPKDSAESALELVDLVDHADSLVGRLSGGQRSRASLAVALLGEPDLLVLDEPTVGLDPVLRRDLWKLFHQLADNGTTLLVSSHVMDEADRCDRLLLLREGELLAEDTPDGAACRDRRRRHRGGVPHPDRQRPQQGGGLMTPRITLAVASRVLAQLRRDHRTVAMLLVVPCVLLTLLWWMFDGNDVVFNQFGPPLLALFPFIVMFLVTSVTTLRERSSGTLERLLSMPMGKADLLLGYALAFGAVALVQSLLAVGLTVGVLDMEVQGSAWTLTFVSVLNAVLGTALGLFVSAFAETEFQAVQFMPALVLPQVLLCGLFVARDALPDVLHAISDVLPLSYAVDAMQQVQASSEWTTELAVDVIVVAGAGLLALLLGAATLRRRTA